MVFWCFCQYLSDSFLKYRVVAFLSVPLHIETHPDMNFSGLSLDCWVKNVEAAVKGSFMLHLQGKFGGSCFTLGSYITRDKSVLR